MGHLLAPLVQLFVGSVGENRGVRSTPASVSPPQSFADRSPIPSRVFQSALRCWHSRSAEHTRAMVDTETTRNEPGRPALRARRSSRSLTRPRASTVSASASRVSSNTFASRTALRGRAQSRSATFSCRYIASLNASRSSRSMARAFLISLRAAWTRSSFNRPRASSSTARSSRW